MLDRGGNAIDAGVAGGLVLNVVQPDMCNFGGVAPILVRPAGGDEVWSVAGLGTWGSEATLEAVRARYGDVLPEGPGNAVVPGAPDAWLTALERWGTWSFADVAAPAIELAEDGFALDPRAAFSIGLHGRDWDTTRAVFLPDGREPEAGDVLRQPELGGAAAAAGGRGRPAGRVLRGRDRTAAGRVQPRRRRLADASRTWPASGPRSRRRCRGRTAAGSCTRRTRGARGRRCSRCSRSSTGFDLPALGHNTAEYLHVLAESVKLAFSDREQWYGDPRFVDVPLDRLLSDEHAGELRARIGERALPNLPTRGEPRPALRHDVPLRRRRRRQRVQRHAERHARVGPARAGARDRDLAARPPEPARPVAPGRARAWQAPAADARASDRARRGRPRVGVRQPGRRRDPPGDAAGVPERRRVRHDPAAGGRGAARRELQLPELVLPAHRAAGPPQRRGADPGGRPPRARCARPRRRRLAGVGVRGGLGRDGARPARAGRGAERSPPRPIRAAAPTRSRADYAGAAAGSPSANSTPVSSSEASHSRFATSSSSARA